MKTESIFEIDNIAKKLQLLESLFLKGPVQKPDDSRFNDRNFLLLMRLDRSLSSDGVSAFIENETYLDQHQVREALD